MEATSVTSPGAPEPSALGPPTASSAGAESVEPGVEPYPSGEPRWIAEVLAQVAARARPFTSTALAFVLHPARFVRRWSSGERFAMNPLWFAGTAVAIIATLQGALQELLGVHARQGILEGAERAVAPYAYYVEIGLAAHVILRVLGSHRRLSSSVAMALYAGGSVASIGQLLGMVALASFRLAGALPAWGDGAAPPEVVGVTLTVLLMVSFAAFYTLFATTMGVLHAVGPVRMFVANALAMVVSSAICDRLPLPTLHVALHIWENGHLVAPVLLLRAGF